MELDKIKTPEDILEFMKNNIKYGWLDINGEEHMHCFLLYFINDKVYQIEHSNWGKIGIYEYDDEETALTTINDYYVKMVEGKSRPVTEFFEVIPNMSFKDFNNYINSLDIKVNKKIK